ncbi:MAG: response regulator transcription factor [Anaerolineales bacterium]|nr:response regulator transcription factor [Anaerolineales bacterium]
MTPSNDPIRVLIVDDHQVVRQGLRTFLELHEDILVVGEAGDGRLAVELARRHAPDVVLMDLVMPALDGLEAIRQTKQLNDAIKIIVLTSFTDDDKVVPAIRAGASSYWLKDISPDELVEAIRAVHRGQAQLPPDIARKLIEALRAEAAGAAGPAAAPAAAELTIREREVVRLVAQGRSNLEIAQALVISDKTVKTHVSNILSKLSLVDRTQLAIYALKHGLAEPD